MKNTFSLAFKRRIRSAVPIPFEQVLTVHFPLGLIWDLLLFRPDLVVSHELGARTLIAATYCTLFRRRLVIWSYNSTVSFNQASPMRQRIRRFLLRRAHTVIGMGTESRAALRSLGVPDAKIFDVPNAAHHEPLQGAVVQHRNSESAANLRTKLGLRENVAICVGRLNPLKGTPQLLEAWGKLSKDVRNRWSLLFLGDGPFEPLVRCAARSQPKGAIVYAGHVPTEDLYKYYAVSDLAIFPSLGDVWGLVVNEAMACGLPVLGSRFAGCTVDLIKDEENGWCFSPVDKDDFIRSLNTALSDVALPAKGETARETVAAYTIAGMAEAIRNAVRLASQTHELSRSPAHNAVTLPH